MRNTLTQAGFDVSGCSDDYVSKLYKLLFNICYIVNDKTDSWYLATMSMPLLNELRRELRIDKDADVEISISDVKNAIHDRKFCIIKLTQHDTTRFRGFLAIANKPKRRPSLENCRVIPLQEIKCVYDNLLQHFRVGSVEINGKVYLSYIGGIPTSGELLLTDVNNEKVLVPLFNIKTVKSHVTNENISKLLTGVYEYNGIKVTLNRDILEKYYGEHKLYSKLESKGVRYRYCYFDILMHGDLQSNYYYKSKYGITEKFSNINELLKIVKNGMSGGSERCIARRLCSVSSLLRNSKNKPSFYVTIPDNAVLVKVASNLELYTFYIVSNEFGYTHCTSYGTDISTAKQKLKAEYGGNFEVVTVIKDGKIIEGLQVLSNIDNKLLRDIAQLIKYSYVECFNEYSRKIKLLAENNGIKGVTDEHIKFLLVNNIAKKYRYSSGLEYSFIIKSLLKFFELFINGVADSKLNQVLRKVCLGGLKKVFRSLNVSDVPESGYRCKYGIIYVKDGKLSKMVELYYDNLYIGKSVISNV